MISFQNCRYKILKIDALEIPPGLTSVIGPNGSGKTTFLKLLAGINIPESGIISIDNRSPRDLETGWVNEVPDRNILFDTVIDEVASPLRFRRIPCQETDKRVSAHLAALRLSHLSSRSIRELSGGEKILVALAAAGSHLPEIFVLDEFDSHLDDSRAKEIEAFLVRSGAQYIIRCTHQMEFAARSNFLVYIENGEIIHAGVPEQVFDNLYDTSFYPLSWRCST